MWRVPIQISTAFLCNFVWILKSCMVAAIDSEVRKKKLEKSGYLSKWRKESQTLGPTCFLRPTRKFEPTCVWVSVFIRFYAFWCPFVMLAPKIVFFLLENLKQEVQKANKAMLLALFFGGLGQLHIKYHTHNIYYRQHISHKSSSWPNSKFKKTIHISLSTLNLDLIKRKYKKQWHPSLCSQHA